MKEGMVVSGVASTSWVFIMLNNISELCASWLPIIQFVGGILSVALIIYHGIKIRIQIKKLKEKDK